MKEKYIYLLVFILFISIERVSSVNDSLIFITQTEDRGLSDDSDIYNDIIPSDNIPLKTINSDLSHIPTIYNIDQAKVVGEIPFQQSLGKAGSVIYNIPIDIYQGRNGFQPNISLIYDSHSPSSMAGIGWGISGISAISVINKSLYFDGFTSSEKTGVDGAYALDGIRLIKTNTTTTSLKYQTEQGNIIVTAYLSGNTIKYFEVFYPNGNKARYGIETNNNNLLSYPLQRLEDINGNYIDYEYSNIYNVNYPTKIQYGGRLGPEAAHFATIKFLYESRADTPLMFFHREGVSQTQILKKIQTYFGSNILKTYSFEHSYSYSGIPLLKKISCTSNTTSLNPLVFYYGENNVGNNFEISRTATDIIDNNNPPYRIISGGNFDFESLNNSSSILFYGGLSNYGPTMINYQNMQIEVRRSRFNSQNAFYIFPDISEGRKYIKGEVGNGFLQMLALDIDGDGIEEIIKINNNETADGYRNKELITYHVYNVVGGELQDKDIIYIEYADCVLKYISNISSGPGFFYSPISRIHLAGDFLGKGINSLVRITHSKDYLGQNRSSTVSLIDFEERGLLYQKNCFSVDPEDFLFTLDYDGDGKTDIGHISLNGMSVYTFIDGELNVIAGTTLIKRADLINHELLIGDINGDGKTDIVLSPANDGSSGLCKIFFSTGCGNGMYPDFMTKNITINNNVTASNFFLQDINGDGKADLIRCTNYQNISAYLSNSNGVLNSESEESIASLNSITQILPLTILQTGKIANIIGIQNNGIASVRFKRNDTKQNTITGMVSSTGVITKHTYQNILASDNSFYQKQLGLGFPYNSLFTDINLLAETKSYVNGELVSSLNYKYYNGVIDKRGRGFISFQKIETKDNIRNRNAIQTFDHYNFGHLKRIDTPENTTTLTYNIQLSTNKVAKILLLEELLYDNLNNISIRSTYSHDTYGNIIGKTTNYGNGIKTEDSYILDNINNSNIYLLCLEKEHITKETRNNSSIQTKTTYNYDNKYRLENKKEFYNNNQVWEEVFSYDTNGNVDEIKQKPYQSTEWIKEKFEYNSNGLMVYRVGPYNDYNDYFYSSKGLLSSMYSYTKDPIDDEESNFIITNYTYDNWERLTKIKATGSADFEETTSVLSWISTPNKALYCQTTQSRGKPDMQVYYDALGREIRTGQKRFDGNFLYVDTEYNNKGQIQRKSLPFKGTSPVYWNSFSYDNYNRLTKVQYSTGKEDAYSYDKLKIISTINNITTTKLTDAMGLTLAITDPAGSIVYNYRPDKQLSSIIVPGNITTEFNYDNYGRQIEIFDPSSGGTTWTYDNSGNISTETDANSKTTEYTYNKYNQLIKKKVPAPGAETTNYVYNFMGQLKSLSNTFGSINYTYDEFSRLESIKEGSVTKWLERIFNYNDGNVVSIKYNSSDAGEIMTENLSYSNGTLIERKINNNTSYWKLTEETNQGIPSKSQTGPLSRIYNYDAYGTLKERQVKLGSAFIQNVSYGFAPSTGRLNWRKDVTRNKTENFGYDDLNRLISFGGNTITYDNKGNIETKSIVGEFDYNSQKPYSLAKIAQYGNEISSHEQTIIYTPHHRPQYLKENGTTNTAIFYYLGNGKRTRMTFKENGVSMNRYYIGDMYEVDIITSGNEQRLYLGGDPYSAPAVYVKKGTQPWTINYICRDYLGSITHVTDQSGNVLQELSYDPWGRLRDPGSHQVYAIGREPDLLLKRGYTGHEYLRPFGLINMNARLYDPVAGRFLSPDPYVSMPGMSQNFNRYSYALNNPLMYTDPDGESPLAILGALAGAYIMGAAANNKQMDPLKWDWTSPNTYLAVASGGGWGYAAAYGFGNPGSFSFAGGAATPYGGASLTMNPMSNSADWRYNLSYQTAAGGSGGISNINYNASLHAAENALYNARAYYKEAGLTGLAITATYSDLFHDHVNYRTLGGEVKPILNNSGKVRSEWAKYYLRQSNLLKVTSVASSGLMAYSSAINISQGNDNFLDWTDAAVGTAAITEALNLGIRRHILKAPLARVPIIGKVAGVYGLYRVIGDVSYTAGQNFGPLTLYLKYSQKTTVYKSEIMSPDEYYNYIK